MKLALTGRTIAIAGGTGGIGSLLAASLDREHARLLIVGGRPDHLAVLTNTLSPGSLVDAIPGDLRKESDRIDAPLPFVGRQRSTASCFSRLNYGPIPFLMPAPPSFGRHSMSMFLQPSSLRRQYCPELPRRRVSSSYRQSTLTVIPVKCHRQVMTPRNAHWRVSLSPWRLRRVVAEYVPTV